MIITIGGLAGTGTTTTAELLSKKLDIPYISDKDREDIKYSCEHGGEYLAISFVSNKENIAVMSEIIPMTIKIPITYRYALTIQT